MTATTFYRQNDVGSRACTTQYWENLVLVVVLVSEFKALYWLIWPASFDRFESPPQMGIRNSFFYTVNLEMTSSLELDVLILLRNKIHLNRKIIYQKTHPSSLPRAKTVPSRFQDTSVRPNGLCCGYTSNNVKFRNSLLKGIIMNVTRDMKLYTDFFCYSGAP